MAITTLQLLDLDTPLHLHQHQLDKLSLPPLPIKPTTEPTPRPATLPNPKTTKNHKEEEAAFHCWRPRHHLIAPRGWMNDPCAPAYDASRGVYHVAFQWNPADVEWGHISWGCATSRDMVRWDVEAFPSITPEKDGGGSRGVFTGCMVPQVSPTPTVGHADNGVGNTTKGCEMKKKAGLRGGEGRRGGEEKGKGGRLTTCYTSAITLPINYTLNYTWGQEAVHIATSDDGGRAWDPSPHNPVLSGPPPGITVTGWRDPFIAKWPSVDRLLCGDTHANTSIVAISSCFSSSYPSNPPSCCTSSCPSPSSSSFSTSTTSTTTTTTTPNTPTPSPNLYALISGGIRDLTPTTFLYHLSPSLTDWRFLGPLVTMPLNFTPSRWAWDFGVNWEVTNFVTLPGPNPEAVETEGEEGTDQRKGKSYDFLIVGVEGRKQLADYREKKGPKNEHTDFRSTHAQMWISGNLSTTTSSSSPSPQVKMSYTFGGHVDHGTLYASNSFFDPITREQILIGWIPEEDLPLSLRQRQGWAGCLSLPRVVRLQRLRGVTRALRSEVCEVGSVEAREESVVGGMGIVGEGGSGKTGKMKYTITTLVAIPDPRLQKLRGPKRTLFSPGAMNRGKRRIELQQGGGGSAQWEMSLSFALGGRREKMGCAGFEIGHSTDWKTRTSISLNPELETVTIDRSLSTRIPGVCVAPETAPHTLFFSEMNGEEALENLDFRVFFDGSVLELFVNDRTAITTRVYPESGTCIGLEVFAEDGLEVCGTEGGTSLVRSDWWELRQ